MYYVIAIARDYNIAISNRAGAPGGSAAFFNARLETCLGPFQTIDCNITIDFDWDAGGAGSGTGQVTIFSGSSGNSTIPAPGNPLTSIAITNISSDCTNYNSIQGCPAFSNATTTTTTTTSTTTTTTTVAPEAYSNPTIKYDQYSGSLFTPGGGVFIWPNTGSGGATYNMVKNTQSTISELGSGTGKYLSLTGGVTYLDEEQLLYNNIYPALEANSFGLNNKSFSYAVVFKTELDKFNNISGVFAINPISRLESGFDIGFSNFLETVGLKSSFPSSVQTNLYSEFVDYSDFIINDVDISYTSKWYLGVFTFNKDAAYNSALKLYLNTSKYDLTNVPVDFSPSTYFSNTSGWQTKHALGWGADGLNIAAVIFWDNVILSQGQVQSLYNEYNSRYTLG
jgi:hypothetical protein